MDNRHSMFLNGIVYTFGRILSYTLLGAILIYVIRSGADTFGIEQEVSRWGALLFSPSLIVVGLLLLFGSRVRVPHFGMSVTGGMEKMHGYWGSLFLGILFALAFCPSSGLLYFGMLIPLSASEAGGYMLPVVYAVATGLPVVAVAWIVAYSIAGIGRFYYLMGQFRKWFNRVVAAVFIIVGVYYWIVNYL